MSSFQVQLKVEGSQSVAAVAVRVSGVHYADWKVVNCHQTAQVTSSANLDYYDRGVSQTTMSVALLDLQPSQVVPVVGASMSLK